MVESCLGRASCEANLKHCSILAKLVPIHVVPQEATFDIEVGRAIVDGHGVPHM